MSLRQRIASWLSPPPAPPAQRASPRYFQQRSFYPMSTTAIAYDSASPSRLLQKTYEGQTHRLADLNLENDKYWIRVRARHEMRNNPHARRLANTYANFVVGSGPALRLHSENEDWNRQVKKQFAKWAKTAGFGRRQSLGEILHRGITELFPAGEMLLLLTSDERQTNGQVALRLQPVRGERKFTPLEESFNPLFRDGIEFDIRGRPIAYYILKGDPGETRRLWLPVLMDFNKLSPDDIIHIANVTEPDQFNGEPKLGAALGTFAATRRFRQATLLAAETAPKFAVFFETDSPELMAGAEVLEKEFMDLEAGQACFLPPGYKASQMKPEHPATTFPEFSRNMLSEAGLAGDMPVNILSGDSSGSNYASARFDGQTLDSEIKKIRQFDLEEKCLDVVFERWLREAVLIGLVAAPPEEYQVAWLWPVNSWWMNPVDQAKADDQNLRNGVDTLEEILARRGVDYEEHLAALKAQDAALKDLPLDFIHPAKMSSLPGEGGAPSTEDTTLKSDIDCDGGEGAPSCLGERNGKRTASHVAGAFHPRHELRAGHGEQR
jgi:lambda family phage portal protein